MKCGTSDGGRSYLAIDRMLDKMHMLDKRGKALQACIKAQDTTANTERVIVAIERYQAVTMLRVTPPYYAQVLCR